MEKILINAVNSEDWETIENQLDAEGIDYDYDSDERMTVDDDDTDKVLEIAKNCGISAEVSEFIESGNDGCMERILFDTTDAEDWENIEDQLDANGIDYDYDEGERMIVSEEDVDAVLEIAEDCGVSAELV